MANSKAGGPEEATTGKEGGGAKEQQQASVKREEDEQSQEICCRQGVRGETLYDPESQEHDLSSLGEASSFVMLRLCCHVLPLMYALVRRRGAWKREILRQPWYQVSPLRCDLTR